MSGQETISVMDAAAELLNQGKDIRLTVTGNSMFPFLRHGCDEVELRPVGLKALGQEGVRTGSIILFKRAQGEYVLHRVVDSTESGYLVAGDAQSWREGPVVPEQVFGVVCKVYRGGRTVQPDDLQWRFAAWLCKHQSFIKKVYLKLLRTCCIKQ
jgi:hypothetical protein